MPKYQGVGVDFWDTLFCWWLHKHQFFLWKLWVAWFWKTTFFACKSLFVAGKSSYFMVDPVDPAFVDGFWSSLSDSPRIPKTDLLRFAPRKVAGHICTSFQKICGRVDQAFSRGVVGSWFDEANEAPKRSERWCSYSSIQVVSDSWQIVISFKFTFYTCRLCLFCE